MKISAQSWHAQLFLWTGMQMYFLFHANRDEFWINRHYQKLHTANLCQYIRTLFVWLPLLGLIGAATILYPIYVFVIWPIAVAGVIHILTFVGVAAVIIAIVVGVIAIEAKWGVWSWPFRKIKQGFLAALDVIIEKVEECNSPKPDGSPGLCTLIIMWIVDRHRRICSLIEIESQS